MDYVFGWSLCVCLLFAIQISHLMTVYVDYAYSQSQAVILQVLSVGGGVVGERGVGDELMITSTLSMPCYFRNLDKAMALNNFQCHLAVILVLSPVE